jgi:hypothetical protein
MADRYSIDDDAGVAEMDDLPRYEKRRRPMRGTFTGTVRRAAMQAKRQGSAHSPPPPHGRRPSGFHRRIIKKPFHRMDSAPVAAS